MSLIKDVLFSIQSLETILHPKGPMPKKVWKILHQSSVDRLIPLASSFELILVGFYITQMLNVWPIYLQNWVVLGAQCR